MCTRTASLTYGTQQKSQAKTILCFYFPFLPMLMHSCQTRTNLDIGWSLCKRIVYARLSARMSLTSQTHTHALQFTPSTIDFTSLLMLFVVVVVLAPVTLFSVYLVVHSIEAEMLHDAEDSGFMCAMCILIEH